jgi:hypothetical protein
VYVCIGSKVTKKIDRQSDVFAIQLSSNQVSRGWQFCESGDFGVRLSSNDVISVFQSHPIRFFGTGTSGNQMEGPCFIQGGKSRTSDFWSTEVLRSTKKYWKVPRSTEKRQEVPESTKKYYREIQCCSKVWYHFFVLSRILKLHNINLIQLYAWIAEIEYYRYTPVQFEKPLNMKYNKKNKLQY